MGRRIRQYSEKVGAITLPSFLGKRCGSKTVQFVAAGIMVLFMTVHMVAQFSAGSTIYRVAIGGNFQTGVLVTVLIAFIYTVLGGFFAVANTDVIQSLLMWVGGLTVVIPGVVRACLTD